MDLSPLKAAADTFDFWDGATFGASSSLNLYNPALLNLLRVSPSAAP